MHTCKDSAPSTHTLKDSAPSTCTLAKIPLKYSVVSPFKDIVTSFAKFIDFGKMFAKNHSNHRRRMQREAKAKVVACV